MYPWELNPALTEERLVTLARVAVNARNRAFAEADRAAGDTNWGLACKAHERLMFSLGRLAEGGEHPWLTVTRDGLYLMVRIEDVPVKVFRGSADRPGSRHLDALRLEHERSREAAPQITFEFMVGREDDDGPWYWLMALETDAAGMVARVVFVQANDAGETRYPWECPFAEQPAAVAAPAEAAVAAPVEVVPAVAVSPAEPQAALPLPLPTPAAPAPVEAPVTPDALPTAAANETGSGRRRAPRRGRPAPQQVELWGAVGAE